MKKFLTAVAMALLLVGCAKETVDLTGINEKLAELENRVSALEGAIASIQSAIGDGVFVQKAEPYVDTETGKTIGVTVTYTSGKVVYFEISPKADYAGPVLGVIKSGSGALVWAIDGVAIKDQDGKEVPVNKTPAFTIDEDGYLWVSIDGGDPVKLGQVQNEGATLIDGIFKDIKVEQDKVVLTLSDNTIVNIPFATAFKLVIEGTEFINDGKAITIPYTVTGKTANTVVGVAGYDPYYFYVEVTEENIKITPLQPESEAVFLIYADSQVGLTSMVSVCVSRESAYVLDPRPEESGCDYVIEGDGGDVEMHVVSNVEIEAKVEEECDWITISSTKSHTYTITAKVAENTGKARVGSIYIYKKGTEKLLQAISIYQAKTSAVTNLSKEGTANSYIVTKFGDYKFKAVKGNSAESVGTVAKAVVLWETDNTATAPKAKSIIAAVGVADGFITFSTPDELKPGNALIAALDASDKVLWSWHIWIPKTEIATGAYSFNTPAAMDRNLGALEAAPATGAVSSVAQGLLYQWGRKDPFMSFGEAGKRDAAAAAGTARSVASAAITLAESIAEPTKYPGNKAAWASDGSKELWGDDGNKTIYDPCPPGYKVPASTDFGNLFAGSGTKAKAMTGWKYDEANFRVELGDPVTVFPHMGYINNDGSYSRVTRSVIWSAKAKDDNNGICAYIYENSGDCGVSGSVNMSCGGVVRCVVDGSAPTTTVTDLSENGTANSYIVSEAGDFKFKAVKGNSTESVGTVASAAIVWETDNTTTAVADNAIIAKVGVDEGYITFSTPATLKPGNALIAAKDAEGKILWSWHIWIPKTTIVTDAFGSPMGTGIKLMDRNLGALVVAEASETDKVDVLSFGLFYQFGRKDPFPGMADGDKHPMALAGVQMTRQDTPLTTEESLAKPTVYSYTKIEGKNEGFNWNSAEILNAWDKEETGGKTIYDPCPVGYRVPVLGDWCAAGDQWTFKSANWWFKLGSAVFPYAGYMDDNGGEYAKVGERNVFWTATGDSSTKVEEKLTNGKAAYIKGDKFDSTTARTARGSSVRCVTEETLK